MQEWCKCAAAPQTGARNSATHARSAHLWRAPLAWCGGGCRQVAQAAQRVAAQHAKAAQAAATQNGGSQGR